MRVTPAILLLLTAAPALAAPAAPDPLGAGQLARLGAGLVLVVALIAVTAWGLRRFGRVGLGGAGLRVVAALPVGGRERLLVVEVGGEQILIGVAPGRIQRLHRLRRPLAAPAPEQAGDGGFAARLRQALGRGEGRS